MKKWTPVVSLLTLVALQNPVFSEQSPLILWDKKPAEKWDHGYGVGNGRVSALSFGGFPKDTLILNEGSIFAKQPFTRKANVAEAIEEARKFAESGKYAEADRVFKEKILGNLNKKAVNYNSVSGSYQQGGLLDIEFRNVPEKTNYFRRLDMENGLSRTEIEFTDGKICCELVADPKNDCIVYRITTSRPALDVEFSLRHPKFKGINQNGNWVLEGEGDHGGTKFRNDILIKKINKKEIIVFSSTSTDYNKANPLSPLVKDLEAQNKQILQRVMAKSWDEILAGAKSYFSELMNRCQVDIGDSAQNVRNLTTPERIFLVKKGAKDPDLVEQLFQFGRYCVVSNSRPGSLPCGLQGLWNPDMNAAWRGCYFLNINCEMNYWPTLSTNLVEFHQPITDFALITQKSGEAFAKYIGQDGYCFGHNVDCWAQTYFSGNNPEFSASLMCGAWLIDHIIEEYKFTGDKALLQKALPIFESNAQFMLSWFRPNEKGEYLSGPGASPETGFHYKNEAGKNVLGYVTTGCSFDQLIGKESLGNYLFICRELGVPVKNEARVREVLAKMPLPKISEKDGRLQEWRIDPEDKQKGHRHFSHLYGIFPGNEFDVLNTPKYADAARKSLAFRMKHGSGHTGWSAGWASCLYSTLGDGDGMEKIVYKLLKNNINPNLFDMHPPFQIDGNFGITQGIALCFLQSQIEQDGRRVLQLLPALPQEWKDKGSAKGLTARGGMVVDLKWENGKVFAKLKASRAGKFRIIYAGKIIDLDFCAGESKELEF